MIRLGNFSGGNDEAEEETWLERKRKIAREHMWSELKWFFGGIVGLTTLVCGLKYFAIPKVEEFVLNKNKEYIFNEIEEKRIFPVLDLEKYRIGYDVNHPEVQSYDFNKDGTNDASVIIGGYDPEKLLVVNVVELYNNKGEKVKEYFGGKKGKLEIFAEHFEINLRK